MRWTVRFGLSRHDVEELLAEQADQRRARRIARRIREARFRDLKPLSAFDWEFNRSAIDRVQIEELASGAFVQRRDNLVLVRPCDYCRLGEFESMPLEQLSDLGHALAVWEPRCDRCPEGDADDATSIL